MKNGKSESVKRLEEESAVIEAAARRAARQAILDQKRTGDPIVVFRDGEEMWVPASEIRVPSATTR